MNRQQIVLEGKQVDIEWETSGNQVRASFEGLAAQMTVKRIRGGAFWFEWNGRSVEAVVTREGPAEDRRYVVSVGGHRISVEFPDSRKRLRRSGSAAQTGVAELRAPMAGKIVRVLQTEGSEVEAGQGVVVMEAMKMQNEIRSPKAGRVVQLAVSEGGAVAAGDLLARIE